jgi:probable O-glycosylation ligase (exosortase A-associated)
MLVFAWISYMNPHRFTWGVAYNFPFAMIAAGAVLAGLVFTRDRSPVPRTRETYLYIGLWALTVLTTFYAFHQDAAWEELKRVSKILLMTTVTLLVINDRDKLRWLFLVMALSIGLLGAKGGLFGYLTSGQWKIFGPRDSFIADNNDFALVLTMALPLLLYLAHEEGRRWLRASLYAMFVLGIVATILTFSRGGFLALAAVAFLLLLKAKRKALAVVLATAGLVVVAAYIPQQWVERMGTIREYEDDRSATGRLNAWAMGWNMAKDRPWTGGGFQSYHWEQFVMYAPNPRDVHDVHSVYFEILGEQGFVAFGIYLGLLASCFLSLRKLKRTYGQAPEGKWVADYADMLQVSLVAFVVGGAFLGRAFFDFFFHLVAGVIILKSLAAREPAGARENVPYVIGREPALGPAVQVFPYGTSPSFPREPS